MEANIKHLHLRAGFGLSPTEWTQRRTWTIDRAVDFLFTEAQNARPLPENTLPIGDEMEARQLSREALIKLREEERKRVVQLGADWITRMGSPMESPLLERMMLFWHGHFACRIDNSALASHYLNTLRKHALGNFRELVKAIARDPAMIRYLNNQQNKKEAPNENFARELLELFTIGRGNYTENDIKEAARAFTGWSSTLAGDFVFRPRWHDFDAKTFFGKTGRFDGNDIIDIVLDQPATARFIARKLLRFFVRDTPDEKAVEQWGATLFRTNYDIGKFMRELFRSEWFYAANHRGAKIKSPVELVAGLVRTLSIRFDGPATLFFLQRQLGQQLFNPPNVAGWPGGKSWIDNATLSLRLVLPYALASAVDIDLRPPADLEAANRNMALRKIQATVQLDDVASLVAGQSDTQVIKTLGSYLLPQPEKLNVNLVQQYCPASDRKQYLQLVLMRLLSLPEYQTC